jgi:hypothetical protein
VAHGPHLDVAAFEEAQAHAVGLPARGDLIARRHRGGGELLVLVGGGQQLERVPQALHVEVAALQREAHLVQAQQAQRQLEALAILR